MLVPILSGGLGTIISGGGLVGGGGGGGFGRFVVCLVVEELFFTALILLESLFFKTDNLSCKENFVKYQLKTILSNLHFHFQVLFPPKM